MKKTIAVLLALLAALSVLSSCGKGKLKDYTLDDPNAALTDSDVPLDLGAVAPLDQDVSSAQE